MTSKPMSVTAREYKLHMAWSADSIARGKKMNQVRPAKAVECTKDDFQLWILNMSKYLSLHGLAWYSRTDVQTLKVLIFMTALAIMVALPIVVATQMAKFMSDVTVNDSVEWKASTSVAYPNITLCNSKYFDKRSLEKYNISNQLATYMLISFDPDSKKHVDFFLRVIPDPDGYKKNLDRLDQELMDVLEKNNFTDILELFHAVAVRCNEFITFCEDHRTFYVSDNDLADAGFPVCCDTFFHSKPFFSPAGTCFTTKAEVIEHLPSTYSNIKIWMNVDEEFLPVYDMSLAGTAAADRSGIAWTLSYEDHPARVLYTSPKRAWAGTSTSVGISKNQVDRTALPQPCIGADATFTERYGIKSTQFNCEIVSTHYVVPNCSIGTFNGLPSVDGLGPCYPSHILNNNEGDQVNVLLRAGYFAEACPYNCMHTSYDGEVTTGQFDQAAVQKMFDFFDIGEYNAKSTLMIQFYFKTFDFPRLQLHQDGFFDFLSKIGGWMSLAIGGSAISFVEIVCFLLYFAVVIVKNFVE